MWRSIRSTRTGRNVPNPSQTLGSSSSAPVRIENGCEIWQVCFAGERPSIEPSLDGVREDTGADIEVRRMTTAGDVRQPERQRRLDIMKT